MSKLEVDKIDPQSGTDLEIGSSGDTITIPSGATLDASNATTTLPANVVTTDGTQTLTNKTIDASQLSGTITPSDGTVTNAKVNASAAIDYSKLNLTGNIALADLSATGTKDATTFLRGDNTFAEAGGGKVLQVQHMTSASPTSTTGSSFVATALTDTITPSATSSKILILATGNINNTSVNNWTYATLRRGGTNLGNSPGMVGVYFAGGDSHAPSTMNYLDSPNSTSELTYDVAIRVSGGTGKWNQQSAIINLTLIEIGA